MPASRNCTKCGAALPGAVRWCGQCYEPVRDFTPRAPIHQGDYVGVPRSTPELSRWRGSDMTFGPAGRVAVSSLLLGSVVACIWMLGPLFLLLGWAPLLAMLGWAFRDIWQPVPQAAVRASSARFRIDDVVRSAKPTPWSEIPQRRRAWIVAAAVGYVVVVVLYLQLPNDWQVALTAVLALVGFGFVAGAVFRR